jgi:hypothetical protein
MLYFFTYFSAILSVIILHAKAWIYFKIKNPNKSILYGYLSGLIGVYFMLSLFPLAPGSKNESYYKKMKNLTFLFYGSFIFFLILGAFLAVSSKK